MLNEDTKEISFCWKAEKSPKRPQVFNRPISIEDIELKAVRGDCLNGLLEFNVFEAL